MPDVTVRGPIFDGRAAAAIADYMDDMEAEVAQDGVDLVRDQLAAVLQNPTGYYESSIRASRGGAGYVVDDSGVVYGPWLAGVGSRNASSSFKGYQHWPQAAAQLAAKAGVTAQRVLLKYLPRMRG